MKHPATMAAAPDFPPFQIHPLRGAEVAPWLDALGSLRIRVFREYPYLYEGSLEYERDYLKIYQNSRESLVVIITDGAGEAIGATTCIPMEDESGEFQQPFLDAGHDCGEILYFGESILLPEWRGRGIGGKFFDLREAHARELGRTLTTFCAVDRPADHPLRPPGYRDLHGFWQARGYVRQPSLQATFSWKEIGEEVESPKCLTFWARSWPR